MFFIWWNFLFYSLLVEHGMTDPYSLFDYHLFGSIVNFLIRHHFTNQDQVISKCSEKNTMIISVNFNFPFILKCKYSNLDKKIFHLIKKL
ncbi:hypothetical protein BpHYR1_030624 [Brachionus plicatilis]|uniref:Uncharacterized protein n=1 Tax=Brachionus plicatilis TaxID=10195 RepID=A0A3M7PWR6_BRAPC|nr:hypothetical protein BpHYR1_030624 [Brachionus plicatilis]